MCPTFTFLHSLHQARWKSINAHVHIVSCKRHMLLAWHASYIIFPIFIYYGIVVRETTQGSLVIVRIFKITWGKEIHIKMYAAPTGSTTHLNAVWPDLTHFHVLPINGVPMVIYFFECIITSHLFDTESLDNVMLRHDHLLKSSTEPFVTRDVMYNEWPVQLRCGTHVETRKKYCIPIHHGPSKIGS